MKRTRHIGAAVYLAVMLVLMYLPIAVVILYSFNANPSRMPVAFTGFTLDWYVALFSGVRGYFNALLASAVVAGLSVLLSTVMGTLGALGLAAFSARRRAARVLLAGVENVTALPIMIPEILMGMALMAAFSFVRMPGGIVSLVVAHTTFCVPYIYILVSGRLRGMDPAFAEAARDLGASPARAFFTVTLPLIAPAVLSGALLAAAMSLDDFVISFFVSDTVTLPRKVYASIRVGVSTQVNALCTLMLVAVFLAVSLSRLSPRSERRAKRVGASRHRSDRGARGSEPNP